MAEPTKHERIVRAIGLINLRDLYSPVEKETMLLILDCLEEQYRPGTADEGTGEDFSLWNVVEDAAFGVTRLARAYSERRSDENMRELRAALVRFDEIAAECDNQ